jgi:polysaccharide export outer membrane protein
MKQSNVHLIPFYSRSIKNFYSIILVLVLMISFTSCVNVKKATYFNNIPDSNITSNFENLQPRLKENDLLKISVSSLNPEATEIFNISNTRNPYGVENQASGYLINNEGYISFPVLGKIKAAGKTKQELGEGITKELVNRKLLLEPIVEIRYLNFRVSVMGEVKDPSVLTIPSEKVTLLEALSLAGDLTIYAKRDNILLIREEDNIKKLRRIDLTTDEIFTSPNYYLKPNDIIYVEPNKSKISESSRVTQWLPIIISVLSLSVIALDRIL